MRLDEIQSPADVRAMTVREAEALAAEIRQALIGSIARTGGHLAPNLGAVELTLALHRALLTPQDKIVFDVGHQSYTHKLITGRQDLLFSLRTEGGVSGFPKRAESEYDIFETGHASTAISAALGMARARDLRGETHAVVALVGDGALTGGMCYEALNDAGSRPTPLVVLLNDNEMSIARNVGALSTYLTRLRGSEKWSDAKHTVKRGLHRIPVLGRPAARVIERVKHAAKRMLVPGEFFEALGFYYLGPIDGHDIAMLERAIADAKALAIPVVVHAVTQKGRGYDAAERQPERFHGVGPFLVGSGKARKVKKHEAPRRMMASAQVVGDTLAGLAAADARIVAITAAMPQGVGLSGFERAYPERFFDVGIAEEHAMTLAAGMAAAGLRPVFAVYASFLQRALDQLLHDVCLQRLPVMVLVEHAGFVAGDGATHQGVYDLGMLRGMPGLTLWAPRDARELRAMIQKGLSLPGPCVIRYPKALAETLGKETPIGAWRRLAGEAGASCHLLSYGHALHEALSAAHRLAEQGVSCCVWGVSTICPLDEKALVRMAGATLVAVTEEASVAGGLGEAVAAWMGGRAGPRPRTLLLGVTGGAPGAHSVDGLCRGCGIDAASIARRVREALNG